MNSYECVNCGNGAHCIITVQDDQDKINDMITCKYLAKFTEISGVYSEREFVWKQDTDKKIFWIFGGWYKEYK